MYLAQSWVCALPGNAAKCQGIKFAAHQRLLPWFAICLKLDNLLLIGFNYEWLTIFMGQQQTSGGPQQGYTRSHSISRRRGFPFVGSRMRWSLGPVPRTLPTSPLRYGISSRRQLGHLPLQRPGDKMQRQVNADIKKGTSVAH